MKITPPDYVQDTLNRLFEHGYTACLVGGCVRDMFLDVAPNDWDIATSALPEQILDIFPNSLTIGMKHGTITVKHGHNLVEVTTFRLDGNYLDHRHPENVQFVSDIKEDLSRRDFTINAIAIAHDGSVFDPFHGLDDLSSHTIRAVGTAENRFEEDALRMFRAFRFASRFGYHIEDMTMSAIKNCSYLASSLSSERIRDELEKILLSVHPQYLSEIISIGLIDKFICKKPEQILDYSAIMTTNTRLSKWSLFCYLLLISGAVSNVSDFLTSLRMDNTTVRICSKTCEILSQKTQENRNSLKILLSKYGIDVVENTCLCLDSSSGTDNLNLLKDILNSGECYSIKDLKINGNDLKSYGITGNDIGQTLNTLLFYVIKDPSLNNYDDLIKLINKQ